MYSALLKRSSDGAGPDQGHDSFREREAFIVSNFEAATRKDYWKVTKQRTL
jgi:hypothetical protein